MNTTLIVWLLAKKKKKKPDTHTFPLFPTQPEVTIAKWEQAFEKVQFCVNSQALSYTPKKSINEFDSLF